MSQGVEEDLDDDRDEEDGDAPVADDPVDRLEPPEQRLHEDRVPAVVDEPVHSGPRLLEDVQLLRPEKDVRREDARRRQDDLALGLGRRGLAVGARGPGREGHRAQRHGGGPGRKERREEVVVLEPGGDEARALGLGILQPVLRLSVDGSRRVERDRRAWLRVAARQLFRGGVPDAGTEDEADGSRRDGRSFALGLHGDDVRVAEDVRADEAVAARFAITEAYGRDPVPALFLREEPRLRGSREERVRGIEREGRARKRRTLADEVERLSRAVAMLREDEGFQDAALVRKPRRVERAPHLDRFFRLRRNGRHGSARDGRTGSDGRGDRLSGGSRRGRGAGAGGGAGRGIRCRASGGAPGRARAGPDRGRGRLGRRKNDRPADQDGGREGKGNDETLRFQGLSSGESGDRVGAARVKRVAPREPPRREPEPAPEAVAGDGLASVLRARGRKPARRRQKGREITLVRAEDRGHGARGARGAGSSRSRDRRRDHFGTAVVDPAGRAAFDAASSARPRRPTTSVSRAANGARTAREEIFTTRSTAGSGAETLHFRKISRTRRRARLRWTALPDLRVAVIPSRRAPSGRARAKTTTRRPCCLAPVS